LQLAACSSKVLPLLLLLPLLAGQQVQAQQRCIAALDVQTKKVVEELCVGQRVRFKDCSNTLRPEVYYDFDFKGTHQNFTDTTSFHTYTVAGTYVVSQFARNNQGVDGFASRTYKVKPQPLTAAQLPVLKNVQLEGPGSPGTIRFSLENLQMGYSYILEQSLAGSASFTPLDTMRHTGTTGGHSYTLPNLETASPRCYHLRAFGFCGGSPDVVSGVVCSQGISATAGDRLVQVSWPAYPGSGHTGYQIYRDAGLLTELPAQATTFQDREVACGRSYCYQVVALLPGSRSSSSLPVCVEATSTTPPKPAVLHTTFNAENQVVVTMQAPPDESVQEVTLQRRIGQGAFSELTKTGPSPFTDLTVTDLTSTVCYQATYKDLCGLSSGISSRSCPMVLQLTQFDESGLRLEWSAYEGFAGGVAHYVVEVLRADGTVAASFPAGTATSYTDPSPDTQQEVLIYRVKAMADNPTDISYSNQVTLSQEFRLAVPNAFSPNGDGLNDRFEVKGRFVVTFRMIIYNSWGQVIFQSKDLKEGWDGRINGKDAPVGTYAFTVEAVDTNGKRFSHQGTVTLLR
jgi:gliding motility-associated-like protein